MTSKSSDKILKRMMDLHPKVIDLTLDRVLNLLDALITHTKNYLPLFILQEQMAKVVPYQ